MAGSPAAAERPAATDRRAGGAVARLVDATPLVAGLVFLGALVVYRATMLPGVGAWDTAEAQTVLPLLGTMHPTGFPAFVVLGWVANLVLAPFGEPAFRMNLLGGILAALAAGGSVLVFRRLGAPALLAGLVGIAFALTPIAWHIGVQIDVHALHVALVVGITLGLLRWEEAARDAAAAPDDAALRRRADRRILATAALFGVSAANHGLTLLLAPGVVAFVLGVDRRILRRPGLVLGAIAVAAGVATLLYLELPLRAGPFRAPIVYGHPETLRGLVEIVLARQFQGDVLGSGVVDLLAALVGFASDQLGPLVVLVPAAFVVTAVRHPRYALYSGLAVVLTCAFAATYQNARIDRYYLGPLFFAWSWFAAAGGVIVDRITGAPTGRQPAGRGAFDPRRAGVAVALGLALLVPTTLGIRDRWSDQDLSQATMAPEWLDQALDAMAPDAVVVSWWSYSTPLWYGTLVEGRRPDLRIVDDRTRIDEGLGSVEDVIEANIDTRPVYLVRLTDAEVFALRDRYVIDPVGAPGNLFRVTGRTETPTP